LAAIFASTSLPKMSDDDYEDFIKRSREAIAAAFTTLKAQNNPGAGPIEESGGKARSKSRNQRVLSRKQTQCPTSDESTSSVASSPDAVANKGSVDESLPWNDGIAVSRKRRRPSLTRPIPHTISVQEEQCVEVKQSNETGVVPKAPNLQRMKELQRKMQLSVQKDEQYFEVKQASETGVVPITPNLRRIKE
jgi:hypothetical protein